MKKISIITPIYKGRDYIPNLVHMIEQCAKQAEHVANIEWIISNDYPEDNITEVETIDNVDVIFLSTDVNRGIHGARIRGLEAATGEYVTFWDQDDVFPDNWVSSQLSVIGDASAVICNQLRNGEIHYEKNIRVTLEKAVTKEYLLHNADGFIPGQVLLRANCIPTLWKTKILTNNCADDYYLWLTMIANNESFVVNKDTYCNHIIHGDNESLDLEDAYASLSEMMDIIAKEHIFSIEDIGTLLKTKDRILRSQLREVKIINDKMNIIRSLLKCREHNLKLTNDSLASLSGKIAIYGADIGMHVYEKLNEEEVKINCIIDRNARWLKLPIQALTLEELPADVSLIIMTLINQSKIVTEEINKLYPSVKVVHIKELLTNLEP